MRGNNWALDITDSYILWKKKKRHPTPAGFEPAPSKRNRFLICRCNHLAIAPYGTKVIAAISIEFIR